MNLGDVMDELAESIKPIIPRTFAYPPDVIHPPAAVVGYPEIVYDSTYGRGMDRLEVPVVVMVGKVSDRASRDALEGYLAGAGPTSIKAAVETGPHTAFDTVRVVGGEPDTITVAGVEHAAYTLTLDVAGGN